MILKPGEVKFTQTNKMNKFSFIIYLIYIHNLFCLKNFFKPNEILRLNSEFAQLGKKSHFQIVAMNQQYNFLIIFFYCFFFFNHAYAIITGLCWIAMNRYDVRAALTDISKYEPPPGGYENRLDYLSADEQRAEQLCEEERYYSLYNNDFEEELYKGLIFNLYIRITIRNN